MRFLRLPDPAWPEPGVLFRSAIDPREGLMTTPPVAPSAPVEAKVKVATIGSYLAGVVGLALVAALSDGSLLAAIPAPYAVFLAPLVPAVVAFASSYLAQHTPRSSGLGSDVDATIAERVQVAVDDAVSRIPGADAGAARNAPVVTDGEVHS